MTPRAVITKHLLDGDDSLFKSTFDGKPFDNKPSSNRPSSNNLSANKPSLDKKLPAGQTPPIDSDAT